MGTNGILQSNAAVAVVLEDNAGYYKEPVVATGWNVIPVEAAPFADATEFTQLGAPVTTDKTQGEQVPGIAAGTWASTVPMRHSGDATGVQAPKWFAWAEAAGLKSDVDTTAILEYDKTYRCYSHCMTMQFYRCGETATGLKQYMRGAASDLTIDFSGGVSKPVNLTQNWQAVYGRGTIDGTGTITSTGASVAGVTTAFDTELEEGQEIICEGQVRIVDTITSATAMTVTVAFSPDVATKAFTIRTADDIRESDISAEAPKKYNTTAVTGVDTTRVATLGTTLFTIGGVALELVSGSINVADSIVADTNSGAPGGINWYARDVGSVTANLVFKKADTSLLPSAADLRDATKVAIVINLNGGFNIALNIAQAISSVVEKGDLNLNQNNTYQVDNLRVTQRTIS